MTLGDAAQLAAVHCSNERTLDPQSAARQNSRVFTVAGLCVWNTLPEEMTSAPSLTIFC